MAPKRELPKHLTAIQGYVLAVVSVCVALGGALIMERFDFRDVGVPLFLFAVATASWYGGRGASATALYSHASASTTSL